jgi:hypothetical protein
MYRRLVKGSLIASFFICSNSVLAVDLAATSLAKNVNQLVSDSKRLVLYKHPRWEAILHVKHGKPISSNYGRYLSGDNFSAEYEMALTIKLIANDSQTICTYPARISFLQEFLTINDQLDLTHCVDYQKYLKKVPVTDIYLVYASENVKSASSMLGHIMLRMDGINDEHLDVSHGITFFTELRGFNVPKILYDSLISGKKGFFQVAPYANFVDNYLNIEQRNVWEYKLSLSGIQKQLIRDIAWELGSADLSYFFDTYNCATVTQLLIASAVPDQIFDLQSLLTPLDVVRFVEDNNLVEKTTLIPSDEWKLRALIDSLPKSVITRAKRAVHSANINFESTYSEKEKLLIIEFYKSYNEFALTSSLINNHRYKENNESIQTFASTLPDYQLEVGEYKQPTDASPDGQGTVGWRHEDDKDWLSIKLFPVASDQGDYKKHVFGETTLTLASLDIWYEPTSNNLKLNNFILYSMHSRIPFDSTFKSYSTGFQFGLERHHDVELNRNLSAFVQGQLGLTYELTQDLGAYIETSLGIASDIDRTYFYTSPQLGAYAYLIGNLKLRAQYSLSLNMQKADFNLRESSIFLDWKIKNDLYLSAQYTKYWNTADSTKSYEVSLRYRF